MLFNSFSFLLFFIVVTVSYFSISYRFRWLLLLLASCFFYMVFIPKYILILAATIIVDYFAGIYIEKSVGHKRKLFLVLSIVANVGFLAFFKYLNFFSSNLNALGSFLHLNYPFPILSIILPIGLSFHTFQAMSYTIEVYRGRQPAERHFGIYALYVMFFPQLVAGPIERPQNLLHQFYEKHDFNYTQTIEGLKLMLWGMFKKVVIADRLAAVVNQVYGNSSSYGGVALVMATLFFAYQIYCDFSGYSDIARGVALVLGFRLMVNFKQPYFSISIAEFWNRWHISLSSWFRDYLYIPLGGNRVSKWRWNLNLFIVFLVSGLWHGANWTFVIWGALHGVYLIFGNITRLSREKLYQFLQLEHWPKLFKAGRMVATFSLVTFAWIFFRANNLKDAAYIVTHLFSGVPFLLQHITNLHLVKDTLSLYGSGLSRSDFLVIIFSLVFLEMVEYFQSQGEFWGFLNNRPTLFRWGFYYLLIIAILFFGQFGARQFIYFQF